MFLTVVLVKQFMINVLQISNFNFQHLIASSCIGFTLLPTISFILIICFHNKLNILFLIITFLSIYVLSDEKLFDIGDFNVLV